MTGHRRHTRGYQDIDVIQRVVKTNIIQGVIGHTMSYKGVSSHTTSYKGVSRPTASYTGCEGIHSVRTYTNC